MPSLSLAAIESPLRMDDSGTVRIGQTRVTLDTLVASYHDGNTAEEIVAQFPSLALSDVHAAIAYYLTHTAEIDAYLQQREREADVLQEQLNAFGDKHDLRQRLLARQASRKNGT